MGDLEQMQEGAPWSPQLETFFFKVFLRLQIAVRMKRTRHQLAPVMTGQKIVDRAVACWMPDRFFIGCFQVVNIQELSGACRFRKLLEKSLFLFQRHIFSYSTAARLWFQRVDPTIVVGHMRSIDCAQRYTRQFANLRLGFPIFPQQYHLDTLSNNRVGLALQRLFQALYLVLVALDHPLPPCESVRWPYRITFTKLWRAPLWRQMLTLVSDSGRYGSGISRAMRRLVPASWLRITVRTHSHFFFSRGEPIPPVAGLTLDSRWRSQ